MDSAVRNTRRRDETLLVTVPLTADRLWSHTIVRNWTGLFWTGLVWTGLDLDFEFQSSLVARKVQPKSCQSPAKVRSKSPTKVQSCPHQSSTGCPSEVQLHLELPGHMTLHDAHIISDQVEADLLAEFPGAEVIIHQDPEGINEKIDNFND